MLEEKELTETIIGAAIDVHRELGPGLLESAYEECLCHELHIRGVTFARQVDLPFRYKGLDCGYGLDVVVENRVVVELKSIEQILRVHQAQLLTDLRLSGKRVGLLSEFQCCGAEGRNCPEGFVSRSSFSVLSCLRGEG